MSDSFEDEIREALKSHRQQRDAKAAENATKGKLRASEQQARIARVKALKPLATEVLQSAERAADGALKLEILSGQDSRVRGDLRAREPG